MNNSEIYLYYNDEKSGPYSLEEIKQMWESGTIPVTTHYWHEGLDDWVEVKILLGWSAPAQVPPPLPSVAHPPAQMQVLQPQTTVARQAAQPSQRTERNGGPIALGVIFIIVASICGLLGFEAAQVPRSESMSRDLIGTNEEYKRTGDAIDRLASLTGAGDIGWSSRDAERGIDRARSDYRERRQQREQKMTWYFVSAVGFGVVGLLLLVASPSRKTSS